MDLWNMKILDPPPINSSKADVKEIDVKFLKNIVTDAVHFFENQQHLCTEAALLSRTIYRLKTKLRSSKDFKAVEKLNRSLKPYLQIQISKVLNTFNESVPEFYRPKKTYLPTKHMIDFVLVRMQSLGKVLVRILETCKVCDELLQQRLRLGHFWKIAIIIYGMVARIFVIVKCILKYSCNLYSNLLPFSSKLANSGQRWLPDGYVFPESLNEWLGIDWVDLNATVIEIPDEEPAISFFNLIEDSDDDIEFCDEYVIVRDEPSVCDLIEPSSENEDSIQIVDGCEENDDVINLSDVETPRSVPGVLNGFNEDVDVGEIINLSDIQTSTNKVPDCEVISLSDIETPHKQLKRGKKRKRSKKTEADAVISNQKPNKKKKMEVNRNINVHKKEEIRKVKKKKNKKKHENNNTFESMVKINKKKKVGVSFSTRNTLSPTKTKFKTLKKKKRVWRYFED